MLKVFLERFARARDDAGSTQILMLMAMVTVLAFTVLAIQVAHANDMRTRAQIAADAAAIAALTPLRDKAVDTVRNGMDPGPTMGLWSVVTDTNAANPLYNQIAAQYAERNDAKLARKVEVSGLYGHTMTAAVNTKDCKLKEERDLTAKDREDLAKRRNLCTDRSGKVGIARGYGDAVAHAEFRMPKCIVDWDEASALDDGQPEVEEITCGPDNVTVYRKGIGGAPREKVLRLFKIRLVGKPDPQKYNGMQLGPGAEGFGPGEMDVADCDTKGYNPGEKITFRMYCVRERIKARFAVPKGIGCYRPDGGYVVGEHPLGRACDFMVSTGMPDPAQAQLGFDISNWAQTNARRYGIMYIIYRQHIWSPSRASEGWRLMGDRGNLTQNHFDHVHISVDP
ncbi:pilus assembly protein TadG-related protein [Spirillospora sp. NPDC127200]